MNFTDADPSTASTSTPSILETTTTILINVTAKFVDSSLSSGTNATKDEAADAEDRGITIPKIFNIFGNLSLFVQVAPEWNNIHKFLEDEPWLLYVFLAIVLIVVISVIVAIICCILHNKK